MRRLLLAAICLELAAQAVAASAAAPARSGADVDDAYLRGRWCDSTNAWMTFDPQRKEINLPNGNTGQRVVGVYSLDGGTITITGPAGAVLTGTLTRIDANRMTMVFGEQADNLRRC